MATRTNLSPIDPTDSSHAARPWQTLISALDLQPHPEGGHYREVFRSQQTVVFNDVNRCAGTSIYYLLAEGAFSAWHRIDADETWYFHAGSTLALHVLQPNGELVTYRLGNPLTHEGTVFQAEVPAGHWFAAELIEPDDFALVGCAVAPGFEFSGFELADETILADAILRHGKAVERLL